MMRFDNFGAYMFSFLFGPLKKGKQAVNQFFIFFKVIGRQFDDVKQAFFRVRDEANVVSCSEIMLSVHGLDREMPRLEGEDSETYRTRLSMKGIISAWSGTQKGIQYVLTALGYAHSRIEPVWRQNPERWAEFIVHLGVGNVNAVKNFYAIFSEIQRVKEGSSKIACIVFTMSPVCATLCVGGNTGAQTWIGLPQKPDQYDFQQALHMGGNSGMIAATSIPEDTSPPQRTSTLQIGGTSAIHSSILGPDRPLSSTTILCTGCVRTIIANQ